MRHFTQSVVVIFVSLTAFPAAATPPDALINNTLSLHAGGESDRHICIASRPYPRAADD